MDSFITPRHCSQLGLPALYPLPLPLPKLFVTITSGRKPENLIIARLGWIDPLVPQRDLLVLHRTSHFKLPQDSQKDWDGIFGKTFPDVLGEVCAELGFEGCAF